jgi:branched-chain amino acid transport system substrate-binding protein
MKIQHLSTLLFLLIICSLTACTGATTSGAAADPIRIGGGFDLTNEEAVIDVPTANGIKLAVKEINAAGGLLGRPVEFILRDSQYRRDVTANISKQLVEEDKVHAVVAFSETDSALAGGPIFQRAGLPFVVAAASSPKIPQQVGDMAFMASFGDNVQAAAAAEFAFKNFGRTAYLLWDEEVEYTVLLARYFNQHFTQLGGTVVLLDSFDEGSTDLGEHIAKVKALPQQPDFYFLSTMPYNAGTTIKQFREAGLTEPIVGGDAYDFPDLVSQAGPQAAEDIYFSTHVLMDPAGAAAEVKKFMAAYKGEYQREPENAFAVLGYDAMYLLADAIKRAGSTEPQAIKKALEETKAFPALTGAISFSPQSHIPSKGVTMIAIKNGKFTLADQVVPTSFPEP